MCVIDKEFRVTRQEAGKMMMCLGRCLCCQTHATETPLLLPRSGARYLSVIVSGRAGEETRHMHSKRTQRLTRMIMSEYVRTTKNVLLPFLVATKNGKAFPLGPYRRKSERQRRTPKQAHTTVRLRWSPQCCNTSTF